MQAQFWLDRWRRGQVGFHRAEVDPYLMKHWPRLAAARDGQILAPMCGKSLDLSFIKEQGHAALGVELSAIAIESFCLENGLAARRRQLPDHDRYETPNLTLICGDFLTLTAAACGKISAVYDRAALVAWPPAMRSAYVEQLALLTPLRAPCLLITMEYPQEQMNGPPFSVKSDEIERLYGSRHEITELERRDILSQEHRFQAKGVSSLHEVCYLLIRRR